LVRIRTSKLCVISNFLVGEIHNKILKSLIFKLLLSNKLSSKF
jgi:hypothetical protein